MEKNILTFLGLLLTAFYLTACATPASTSDAPSNTQPVKKINADSDTLNRWQKYSSISSRQLKKLSLESGDESELAWIQLALINKRNQDGKKLLQALLTWQTAHPEHPANQLIPSRESLVEQINLQPPQNIAVILPLNGQYASLGKTVRSGILSAYFSHFKNASHQKIRFYDSSTTKHIKQLYQQAAKEGADFIIGPFDKSQVKEFSNIPNATIPGLALNYSQNNTPKNNLFEFGLLPEDEARQMASHAFKHGNQRALVLVENNEWSARMARAFTIEWQKLGGEITETWQFHQETALTTAIPTLLKSNPNDRHQMANKDRDENIVEKYRRNDFDSVFVFAEAKNTQTILPLLRFNYVTRLPVYTSSAINDLNHIATKKIDLNGVTVCDIPWGKLRHEHVSPARGRFYAVGKDAYLLSQSIRQLQAVPAFPLYGYTGTLVLQSNQEIHRHLPCRTFRQRA